MYKEVPLIRTKDWSISLEDPYYVENREEIFRESLNAVKQTGTGCYVNIVTPEGCGHPNEWFIPVLHELMEREGIVFDRLEYMDECGCGGHVSRVYR